MSTRRLISSCPLPLPGPIILKKTFFFVIESWPVQIVVALKTKFVDLTLRALPLVNLYCFPYRSNGKTRIITYIEFSGGVRSSMWYKCGHRMFFWGESWFIIWWILIVNISMKTLNTKKIKYRMRNMMIRLKLTNPVEEAAELLKQSDRLWICELPSTVN